MDKTLKEFHKTDKHKECTKKSEENAKLDKSNIFNPDTQQGTTFSNCTERKEFEDIKMQPVKDNIDLELEELNLEKRRDLPKITETTSQSTETQQSIVTDQSVDSEGGAFINGEFRDLSGLD